MKIQQIITENFVNLFGDESKKQKCKGELETQKFIAEFRNLELEIDNEN